MAKSVQSMDAAVESHGFSAASHTVTGSGSPGHRHTDLEIQSWDRPVQLLLAGRVLSIPAGRPTVLWAGNPHLLLGTNDGSDPQVQWITLPFAWLQEWNLQPAFIGQLVKGQAVQPVERPDWAQRIGEWIRLIRGNSADREIALLELQAFLLRLQRELHSPQATTYHGPMPDSVVRAVVWAMDHYREGVSASDVAAALGVNNKYLITAFGRHMGQTLQAYLNHLRIMEARRLLQQTDRSVTRIAFDCGFNSANRFYIAFKQDCGTTPRAYRLARGTG